LSLANFASSYIFSHKGALANIVGNTNRQQKAFHPIGASVVFQTNVTYESLSFASEQGAVRS